MKLKKGPKRALIIILVLLVLGAAGGLSYYFFFAGHGNSATKVISTIDGYGYNLKASKSKKYKELFQELDKVLSKKNVDEKQYARLVSRMFILDFYSLSDKIAKTDVGGIDFIHSTMINNFLLNAEDTYYKYVESNIYGKRNQDLPTVKNVKVQNIEQTEFTYGETTDSNAYVVAVTWEYKEDSYNQKYQTSATLTFAHEDNKLALAELTEETTEENIETQD